MSNTLPEHRLRLSRGLGALCFRSLESSSSLRVRISTHTPVPMSTCISICQSVHMPIHMCVRTLTHTFIHRCFPRVYTIVSPVLCTHVYAHVHAHLCTHVYTHVYTHVPFAGPYKCLPHKYAQMSAHMSMYSSVWVLSAFAAFQISSSMRVDVRRRCACRHS